MREFWDSNLAQQVLTKTILGEIALVHSFKLSRRSFLASTIAAPIAGRAFANAEEYRHLRFAIRTEQGAPDRLYMQFARDATFNGSLEFNLTAPTDPNDPAQFATIKSTARGRTVFPVSSGSGPAAWNTPADGSSFSITLRAPYNSGGITALPENGNPTRESVIWLEIVQERTASGLIWAAKLQTRFWSRSPTGLPNIIGFGREANASGTLNLLEVLQRRAPFRNTLGAVRTAQTLQNLFGLPFSTRQSVPVEAVLHEADGQLVFAFDWLVAGADANAFSLPSYGLAAEALAFAFPVQDEMLGHVYGQRLAGAARLSSANGTVMEVSAATDSDIPVAAFNADVRRIRRDGQPTSRMDIPAADRARLTLRHRNLLLADLELPEAAIDSSSTRLVDGRQRFHNFAALGIEAPLFQSELAGLRFDLPVEMKEGNDGTRMLFDEEASAEPSQETVEEGKAPPKKQPFDSYTFGLITLFGEDARLQATTVGEDVSSFEITGRLAGLGLALREEASLDAVISSRMTWPDLEAAEPIVMRLVGVPPVTAPSEPSGEIDEEENRRVVVHQSAILLDWRRNTSWDRTPPFADAPLDVALDGAVLRVERDTDLLALDFRFFNFRMLSDEEGTKLRMVLPEPILRETSAALAPNRPILSMEVPGGHLMTETFNRQLISSSDLPQPNDKALMSFGEHEDDMPGPAPWGDLETAELYHRLRLEDLRTRVDIRKELQRRIDITLRRDAPEVADEFAAFGEAFRKKIGRSAIGLELTTWLRRNQIPSDQCIYIGPNMMDRDLWPIARQVALELRVAGGVSVAAKALLKELAVADTPDVLRARQEALAELNEDAAAQRTAVDVALSRERRIPENALFAEFDAFYRRTKPLLLPDVFPGVLWLREQIEGSEAQTALMGSRSIGRDGILNEFITETEKFDAVSKSRSGGASRLCYAWDTREDATEDTPFALDALLTPDRADLSVPPRARRVFEVDSDGSRREVFDFAKSLYMQGIRPRSETAPGNVALARMADVYRSAARPIKAWETDWELLARVHFSFHEEVRLEFRKSVPDGVYAEFPEGTIGELRPAEPAWSVSLASIAPRQGLRAIASPDFNPLVFLQAFKQSHDENTDPALTEPQFEALYAPPNRGSDAPWTRARPVAEEGQVSWAEAKASESFRSALTAYDRHSLVVTSIPGRPTVGDIEILDEDGNVIETTSESGGLGEAPVGSLPVPPGYELDDIDLSFEDEEGRRIRIRQAIMTQQDFGFSQATLSPLGPSVSISAPFLLKVPGNHSGGQALFEATEIEQFDHESTYSEPELTRIKDKGYLFPLGHRASRVRQTSTAVIHPDEINGREYPATKEITRTWISVAEPVKTQWFGQALNGRERPFDQSRIVTLRTPDLVSPDDDSALPPRGRGDLASGLIDLGAGTKGLVFWPRIAAHPEGTFPFQVIFDDGPAAVEMPLIFVSFGAATHAPTLEKLCDYYMSLGTGAQEAKQFLRQVQHAGARRRYAIELNDADTTYETESWIFGAEGRPITAMTEGSTETPFPLGHGVVKARGALFENMPRRQFKFDALLAATDQPPFYPFLQTGRVRLDRIAKQMGLRRGVSVDTSYDVEYLTRRRPSGLGPGLLVPGPEQADIVLGIAQPPKFDPGARGDTLGAIGRPSGYLTAIARREGPILYKDKVPPETIPFNAFSNLPTQYSGYFTISSKEDEERGRKAITNVGQVRRKVEIDDLKVPTDLKELICLMLGNPDMKILGVIQLCDLLGEIVGSLSENIPVFQEAQDFGLSAIGAGIDAIKEFVIAPTRDVLDAIEDQLNTAIIEGLSVNEILPDLANSLTQLDKTLQDLQETKAYEEALTRVSACVAAGKTVVRELEKVADDPVAPLKTGLLKAFEGLIDLSIVDLVADALDVGDPKALIRNAIEGAEAELLELLRERVLQGTPPNAVLSDVLQGVANDLSLGKVFASASMGNVIGQLNLEEAFDAFTRETLTEAFVTVFYTIGGTEDAPVYEPIVSLEVFAGSLDPNDAGKAKWDAFARRRLVAFRSILDDAIDNIDPGDLIPDPVLDALLSLIELYEAAVELVERVEEQKRIVEVRLQQIEDDLESATQQAQQALRVAQTQLRARRDALEEEVKAALSAEEERLTALIRSFFRIDLNAFLLVYEKVEAVIAEAEGSAQVGNIARAVSDLVLAVDEAAFAGKYTTELGESISAAAGDIVAPVHQALCVVIDYINSTSGWLAGDLLTEAEIEGLSEAFGEARKGLEVALAEGDAPERVDLSSFLDVVRRFPALGLPEILPDGSQGEGDALRTGIENYLTLIVDLLNAAGDALEEGALATIEGADVYLQSLREEMLIAALEMMAATEGVVLELVRLSRLRQGTELVCPSVDQVLRELLSSDPGFLSETRARIETQINGWGTLIQRAEAAVKTYITQLKAMAATLEDGLAGRLKTLLEGVDTTQDSTLVALENALKDAEEGAFRALSNTVRPAALMILRAADRALGEINDGVLEAQGEAKAILQRGLANIERSLQDGAEKVPALTPIADLGQQALKELRGRLNHRNAEADRSLRGLIYLMETSGDLRPVIPQVEDLPQLLRQALIPGTEVPKDLTGAVSADSLHALLKSITIDKEAAEKALTGFVDELESELQQQVWDLIKPPVRTVALAISEVYDTASTTRNSLLTALSVDDDLDATLLTLANFILGVSDLRALVVVPGYPRTGDATMAQRTAALLRYYDARGNTFPPANANPAEQEGLEQELRMFQVLARENVTAEDAIAALKDVGRIFGGGSRSPALFVIAETLADTFQRIVSGDLEIKIDLAELRDQLLDHLLSFVPTTITRTLDHKVPIQSLEPIFLVEPGATFSVSAKVKIDIRDAGEPVIEAAARLSPFSIALFGDAFDIITLKFSAAEFVLAPGKPGKFDITFAGYEIGPQAEFIAELAESLGQDTGKVYIEPTDGFPGIVAGYRLSLPAMTFGAANFLNVGIVAGAMLPFDNREALFSVGISSRNDPFIITIGVWGGGGHFTLYSNGQDMVGFDVGFVFGGAGEIAAGPLQARGRVSVGIFLRKFGDYSETLGDFYAGGKAKIAIFSIAASLRVQIGQDGGGNMVGSAVFKYSFSVGFAKFRFSITLYKKEDKGLKNAGGEASAGLLRGPGMTPTSGVRWANASQAGPLHDQLLLASLQGVGEAKGEGNAKIEIFVDRFEEDFFAWRENFADAHEALKDSLEGFPQ